MLLGQSHLFFLRLNGFRLRACLTQLSMDYSPGRVLWMQVFPLQWGLVSWRGRWIIFTSLLLKYSEQRLSLLPKWSGCHTGEMKGVARPVPPHNDHQDVFKQCDSRWCLIFKAHYCCLVLIVTVPLWCTFHPVQGQRRVTEQWDLVVIWLFLDCSRSLQL